ncbi:polyol transporter 5-like [Panicum hallii]|nr:polyol transporter 5-like [Panicum hallii]
MAHGGVTAAPLLPSAAVVPGTPHRNRFAFLCATLASMTTILMGYTLALMSSAQLLIREDLGLTGVQVEVLTGSMNLFMLVSVLGAGWAADLLGRRGTLVLANAFLMAGALAISAGGSYASLMAARFVTSVGVGFARVVAPVYNAEISPASTRGVLSSLLDMFVNVGILLSYVSNYAFASVAVGVVKTCFILVATFLSDRVGRRPLLLASAAGAATALASVALTLCAGGATSSAACVASVLAFVAAFSVGFGPVVPTYSSEAMPLQGTSLGTAVNRVTCGVVTMTFISLAGWITMPWCFFLCAGVAAAAWAFVCAQLPETSGRGLEDMDVLFSK